jgi:hypothetical protein
MGRLGAACNHATQQGRFFHTFHGGWSVSVSRQAERESREKEITHTVARQKETWKVKREKRLARGTSPHDTRSPDRGAACTPSAHAYDTAHAHSVHAAIKEIEREFWIETFTIKFIYIILYINAKFYGTRTHVMIHHSCRRGDS